ncbi:hypothetical protein Q1695_010991 [Nippostrongylus brasiliensis]|nr:hypothetical protein Q1695_010991 [Nippostrongylus brasiliensis]
MKLDACLALCCALHNDPYLPYVYHFITIDFLIISTTSGAEVGVGERGEICVSGPTVMRGYLNRPQATDETIDADGWLHTGDIGFIDENGQTFIVDRLKELIKVKGLQVAPAELEDILLSHKEIKDAAVIGVPDEKTGEKPRAYVVAANSQLTEGQVQRFIEEKVSSYKHLTGGVAFVTEIPKSPSGKILRRVLREQYKLYCHCVYPNAVTRTSLQYADKSQLPLKA